MDYKSNDDFFAKNFNKLVEKHGGQWIIIVKGKKFKIGHRENLKEMLDSVKKRYPHETPLIAPIPTEDEIQCIL